MKEFTDEKVLILVIDEKQEILRQVTSALDAANYATSCCTTAESALTAAEENPPHLIISSTSLNGDSGLEICQRIKQCPGLETVPIMFLSGGQIPDIIRRHDSSGGTYYLRKPFDDSVLLELVDKALRTPAMVSG
jgi:DNA-binding response OmpR family regulator